MFLGVGNYRTELPQDPKLLSKYSKKAKETLEQAITKIEGKHEVYILWKDDELSVPNNLSLAIVRMVNMERKPSQDLKFHEMYTITINVDIKQRHVVKVTFGK